MQQTTDTTVVKEVISATITTEVPSTQDNNWQ